MHLLDCSFLYQRTLYLLFRCLKELSELWLRFQFLKKELSKLIFFGLNRDFPLVHMELSLHLKQRDQLIQI